MTLQEIQIELFEMIRHHDEKLQTLPCPRFVIAATQRRRDALAGVLEIVKRECRCSETAEQRSERMKRFVWGVISDAR